MAEHDERGEIPAARPPPRLIKTHDPVLGGRVELSPRRARAFRLSCRHTRAKRHQHSLQLDRHPHPRFEAVEIGR